MADSSGAASAVYTHRGTRAIQRLVEYAPCSGGLALWAQHRDVAEARAIACNDGRTVWYGPDFDRLPLPRQTGLVAHQVLHIALRHAPRYLALSGQVGDVDLPLFNICADAIVNSALSHLAWLELDEGPRLERILAQVLDVHQDAERALLDWDVERLYRAIDDREPLKSPSAADGRRPSDAHAELAGTGASTAARADGPRAARVRALGRHSPRDLVPSAGAERPEAEAEDAREWRERLLRGHAGDGALSLLRTLLADLPRVRTPWEQILRTQLARGLSHRPTPSWSRPARSYLANQGRLPNGRRMPWEPGTASGKAVARLAVMVDVSGSIEDRLLRRFASEIEAITRRLEAETLIVVGDDRVRRVEVFEPGRSNLRELSFQGGGGTDFTPLLEEADRWRPDIGVFLTDLEGPADYRPGFPVLWAVPPGQADASHPFGRKLVLD